MGGSASYDKPKEMQSKYFGAFLPTLPRMDGKVVAITGCTTGTGFACAKTCAELGATVVMLNRASERADAAAEKVRAAAKGGQVMSVPCDLTSFASVRTAAARLREELKGKGIDSLCLNAGVMACKDEATGDGYDVQMQTNHLSHFLLTQEVWPLIEEAQKQRGDARVVTHASIAAYGPPLEAKYLGKNGGNLGGDAQSMIPGKGPTWDRYHQTKLACLVFASALHDRLQKSGSQVKALCAHPGVAATELQVKSARDFKTMSGWIANLIVSQTAEDGAMGILRCCCSKDVVSGTFYGPGGMTGFAGPAEALKPLKEDDAKSRDLLWEASEAATGVKFQV